MSESKDDQSIIKDQAARFAEQHKALGMLGRKPVDAKAWRAALAEGGCAVEAREP